MPTSRLSSSAESPRLNNSTSIIRWTMEAIIWLIVVISPWLVGGYLPQHMFVMSLGLCGLLLLWSLQQIIQRQLTIYLCWVSLLLVLLFAITAVGLIPMSRAWMQRLSPAAVELYDALLPATREIPVSGPIQESLPYVPGSTSSLNPGATQIQLLELLAVFILFFVTRHGLATPQSLKRLALVLVLNGCALSIFGLVQKVRFPSSEVYGIEVAGAEVFGPFINRNHFASYVNFSICLGIGLFLANLGRNKSNSITYEVKSHPGGKWGSYHFDSILDILQHPMAVWILAPVAVCITAVVTSLSRGGIIAMGVGLGTIIFSLRRRGLRSLVPLLVILALALGLLVWYGAEPALQRLEQEHLATEGRFNIWRAAWSLACQFPVLGTGGGTFFIVEPTARPAAANQSITHLHAHNEYLEALVEGGVPRLLIILGLIFLVFWYGHRAISRDRNASTQSLVAGALGGCVALAVQSLGEFGIHLPAIAAVAAVVAAHLTALGGAEARGENGDARWQLSFFGLGPIVSFVLAASLALPLFAGMWKFSNSEVNRQIALRLAAEAKNSRDLQQAIRYFDEAIAQGPAYQRLRLERFETQQLYYQIVLTENRDRLETALLPMVVSRAAALPLRWPTSGLEACVELSSQPLFEQSYAAETYRRVVQDTWRDQQRHLLAARDNCPLAWRAHLDIAQYVKPQKARLNASDQFQYWAKSDSQEVYLNRIKLLHPHRAETWFLCGQQEGVNGERAQAIRSWRRSLEISDAFLEPIVRESTLSLLQPEMKLDTKELMEKLIPPNQPKQLIKAAWLLYPKVTEAAQRRPFMDAALAILDKSPQALEPEFQYYYGLALWGVNKRDQAARHLADAVRRESRRYPWRLDLGRLYYELQQFSDAREQAFVVLQADPNNPEAKELMEKLDKAQRSGP